jgi:vacuolar-type H+-ATPase subunit C/Vma6
MGNQQLYGAVVTKIQAMKAKLLTPADFENIERK